MNQQKLPFECIGQEGVNYICQELIGTGSQGLVFRGIRKDQPQLKVAIKFSDETRDDELQFLHRLKKTSNDFKHIIKYFEVIENLTNINIQGNSCLTKYCFVMELGSKNLLEEIIQQQFKYSEIQKIEIINQMALGIQELHNFKHIHRDVKPENIIKVGDLWKLCDFGFIKHQISQHRTYKVGTPYYIAPEVFLEDNNSHISYNNKVDIWSLGCIIYEIFTGNLFFNGNSPDDVAQQIVNYCNCQKQKPKEQNTDIRFKNIPNFLIQVLCKCMIAVDPQERYDSHKVVEELNKIKMNANINNAPQIPKNIPRASNIVFQGNHQLSPNQQQPTTFQPIQSQNQKDPKLQIQNPLYLQTNNNNQQIQPSTLQINQKSSQINPIQNQNNLVNLQNNKQFPIQKIQPLSQQLSQSQSQPQIQPQIQPQPQQQFQIQNQQQIYNNIPRNSQQIENSNIFNLQNVNQTQNILQTNFQQTQKQNQDFISKFLDKIITKKSKNDVMTYVLSFDEKIQINSNDKKDNVKLEENLLKMMIQFINNKIESNLN